MKREKKFKVFSEFASYGSLGISVALSIFIGLFIGLWLDKKFDTTPVFMLVFLGLGIAAGFRNIWHEVNRLAKEDKRDDTKSTKQNS